MKNYNQIRSQFCTCRDSWAVITCAKLWPDWRIKIEIIYILHTLYIMLITIPWMVGNGARNSWYKFCKNTLCSWMKNDGEIRSQFRRCHGNWAVVTYAILWPDWVIRIRIRPNIIFMKFQVWIPKASVALRFNSGPLPASFGMCIASIGFNLVQYHTVVV